MIDNKRVEIVCANEEKPITELRDSSYQGVKRLFVLAYNDTSSDNQVCVDSFKKYFLPRVKVENYNIKIDGRNLYDQPKNDSLKKYDEMVKSTAANRRVIMNYILKKSKEAVLQFSKRTTKVL